MKEIVKYRNEMNALHFHGFSAVDLNILMALCSKMRDKDEDVVTFDFVYLKELMKYESDDRVRFVEDLKRMNEKLMKVTAHFLIEKKEVFFVLFPTFTIDYEEQTLSVRVNPDFKFLLNEITSQFTLFELQEFLMLSSKYSKNLYRLLKQYRKTGTYRVDINEFRQKMDIPNTYENRDVLEKAIKPAIEEMARLSYFKSLKVNPIKARKRGAPVIAYEFTFQKSEQIPGQESFYDTDSFNTYTKTVCKPTTKKGKNKFNDFQQNQYSKEEWNSLEDELCEN